MSVKYYPAPLRFRPKQPVEPKAADTDTTQANNPDTKAPKTKKKAKK